MCCIKFIGRCLCFVFLAGVGAGAGAVATIAILGDNKTKKVNNEKTETES